MYFGENLTLNLSKILHQTWVRLKKEIILGGGKRLIGIFLLEVRLLSKRGWFDTGWVLRSDRDVILTLAHQLSLRSLLLG